jgi:hypothetical protein
MVPLQSSPGQARRSPGRDVADARVAAFDPMSSRRKLQRTGWVVDMRHYIDEETEDFPETIPERVLSLAIFFGAIVAWVTDHLPEGDEHTNVPCRRSPGRRRCRGDIMAELDRSSGYIVWECPLCGDHGVIHGWENTLWNRSGPVRTTIVNPPSKTKH